MISCSLCDFQAFSKGNLTFHLNSIHFKDKEYMCRLCHFKTAYKGALTRHVNSVHLRTGKDKECPICGYVTSSLLNLNSHLSVSHHLEIATAFARPSGVRGKLHAEKGAIEDSKHKHVILPPPLPARTTSPVELLLNNQENHHSMVNYVENSSKQRELAQLAHLKEVSQAQSSDILGNYHFAQLNILYRELQNQHHNRLRPSNNLPREEVEEKIAKKRSHEAHHPRIKEILKRCREQEETSINDNMLPEDLSQTSLTNTTNTNTTTPPPSPTSTSNDQNNVIVSSSSNYIGDPQYPTQRNGSKYQYHNPSISSTEATNNLVRFPDHLRCRLCNFQASSQTYLKNHLRIVHLEEIHTLSCPMCEYTSDRKDDVEQHLDLEHSKVLSQIKSSNSVITID